MNAAEEAVLPKATAIAATATRNLPQQAAARANGQRAKSRQAIDVSPGHTMSRALPAGPEAYGTSVITPGSALSARCATRAISSGDMRGASSASIALAPAMKSDLFTESLAERNSPMDSM